MSPLSSFPRFKSWHKLSHFFVSEKMWPALKSERVNVSRLDRICFGENEAEGHFCSHHLKTWKLKRFCFLQSLFSKNLMTISNWNAIFGRSWPIFHSCTSIKKPLSFFDCRTFIKKHYRFKIWGLNPTISFLNLSAKTNENNKEAGNGPIFKKCQYSTKARLVY